MFYSSRSLARRLASLPLGIAALAAAGCTGTIEGTSGIGPGGSDSGDAPASALRRLSVRELGNSIEALTGVRPDALSRLPPDAQDFTFGRVVNSQTVSRVHLEAMELVADEVVSAMMNEGRLAALAPTCRDEILPPAEASTRRRLAAVSLSGEPTWAICQLGGENCTSDPLAPDAIYFRYADAPSVSTLQTFAASGTYVLELDAMAEQGATATLSIDGASASTDSLAPGQRTTLSATVQIEAGGRALEYSFAGGSDERLHIFSLTVEGPVDPNRGQYAAERRACALDLIDAVAPRAFRRPLEPARRDRLVSLYDAGAADGNFATGIRMVFESVLRSPYFGYLVLEGEPVSGERGRFRLNDYEVAARLSFALCETTPDDELWAAAEAGELRTADQVEVHARRLLDAPCGRETVRQFFREWLWVSRLDTLARDPQLFPFFGAATADAMRREVERFVEEITFSGGSVRDVFSAGYSWVNRDLAPIYGLDVTSEELVRTDLPPERAGVLTLPGVLAATAKFAQTSPIIRGVFLNEQILCVDLPSPPEEIDVTPPALDPEATTRERFARHTADDSCRSCHELIDPAGFAFENFDAVGRVRTTENGLPVDASGGAPAIGVEDGSLRGGADLARAVAESDALVGCFARKLYRFGLARLEEPDTDAALLAELAALADGSVYDALVAVTSSYAFRHRVIEDE